MNRQSGEVRIGTVIWLLIFAATALVCWEAIPVKMRSSQLQDFMVETAKFSSHQTATNIKKTILRRSQELDLPVTNKGLDVKKGNGRIKMYAKYTIPLEFPFYTYNWEFEHTVDRPVFII